MRFDRWFDFVNSKQDQRLAEIAKTEKEAEKMKKYVHPIRCCKAIEEAIDDDSFIIADGNSPYQLVLV